MAVATQQRPKTKTGQWSAIFPPDQVTHQQSAIFVKKLLAVAVSTITYLRTIFPEHAFGDRSLEDLNLKVLKDDSACPGACQVIKWMKGCFDALDKKYLRAMIIGMYVDPNDPDTAIETYTFKFSYSQQGPEVDIYRNKERMAGAHTEAQTKRATLQLLRTILVMTQSLRLLPDEVMMTMKLLYYDDVTPADYEPPGFKASDTDRFSYEEEPINLRVGEVSTPFHIVKLRITTDKKQFEMREEGEGRSQEMEEGCDKELEDLEMEDVEKDDKECEVGSQKSKIAEPKTGEDVPDSSPNIPSGGDEASQSSAMADEEENIPQCPCGSNEDDGLMIQCESCRYWQHAVCFMITDEKDVPEKHFCNQCAKVGDPNCGPTDPYLSELNVAEVRATCLWRRTLEAVVEMERITAPSLHKRLAIEVGIAQGLLSRLQREGYCAPDSKKKKLVKVVNRERILTHGFQKYLTKHRGEEKEDREDDGKAEQSKDQDDDVAAENVKNRKGLKRRKMPKTEVEKLTEQAAGLNVSGSRTRSRRPSGKDGVTVIEELPKRSAKRKASTLDGKHNFDVSCSQEMSGSQTKRRKSSVVNNPILA
ncbi:uncharacterized protein [Diadema antillarum]|uniref:uncharacterized protein n=1 Tax=Diadema antillarum TaxID=105358 RepID=UPI003A84521B